MAKSFLKVLPELIEAKLLTEEKAEDIRQYFEQKPDKSQSRLIIVFGILGSLLIGLGIILIIAHNWDNFSKLIKSIFAFFPLVVGQLICIYVISKRIDNIAWREGAAAFLFLAVGACISLISQIYHIPGNLSSFLLTWMLLCLPTIYLLRSTIAAVFIIVGITFYACETSYWSRHHDWSWGYWLTIGLIVPHYYQLFVKHQKSNFVIVLSWLIPLSITISLGTLADRNAEFMYISYLSWFGICLLLGSLLWKEHKNLLTNAFTIIGWSGTIVVLLIWSFDWFWNELIESDLSLWSVEFGVAILTSLITTTLLLYKSNKQSIKSIQFVELIFMMSILIFLIGTFSASAAVIMINLLVLLLGILTVVQGAQRNHLGILNFGLLIVTALILCRFFDEDISFVMRGILFVAVGFGFFTGNYVLLKKRKKDAT